jgi:hypothetical protein
MRQPERALPNCCARLTPKYEETRALSAANPPPGARLLRGDGRRRVRVQPASSPQPLSPLEIAANARFSSRRRRGLLRLGA